MNNEHGFLNLIPQENSASTRRLSPPWGNEEQREGDFNFSSSETSFSSAFAL